MARTPLRIALAASVALTFLAGCGASGSDGASDDTTTTEADAAETTETTEGETTETTEAGGDEEPSDDGGGELCEPLQVLSDYDIESSQLIAEGDWAATQEFFVESTDDVLAAYDDAIALDSELTADLEALRGVTESTATMASESSSIEELSGKLMAEPGIMEAGEAGLRVNTYAEENCGFSTGGNGG